jgi:hypothetical protein
MKLLDLFTGTGSIARVARDLGFEVVSLDIDPRCQPDICADIMVWDPKMEMMAIEPGDFEVIWASPPCETFSCARKCNIGRNVGGELMTAERLNQDMENVGVPILRRTQELIEYLKPKAWYIENPYTGHMKEYISEKPYIFDYCMFGFDYRKRTAVWSNINVESKMCDRSHLTSGKHRKTAIGTSKTQTGQGGGSSKSGRYAIPESLVIYLLTEFDVQMRRKGASPTQCKTCEHFGDRVGGSG